MCACLRACVIFFLSTRKEQVTESALAARSEHQIASILDVARIGRLIDATRSACGHALNERSSRSHCIIVATWVQTLTPAARQPKKPPKTRVSTKRLIFVDLAGSERVNKSGVAADGGAVQARVIHIPGSAPLHSTFFFLDTLLRLIIFLNTRAYISCIDVCSHEWTVQGSRFDEARNVNTSLSALGRVIVALANGDAHIPYRDSTLTQVTSGTEPGVGRVYSNSEILLMFCN
jgi:hypothetical protein